MWFATVHNRVQLWESEVVFMVDFLLFLIIGFMISITINVTLLAIIHSQCVQSIINKE